MHNQLICSRLSRDKQNKKENESRGCGIMVRHRTCYLEGTDGRLIGRAHGTDGESHTAVVPNQTARIAQAQVVSTINFDRMKRARPVVAIGSRVMDRTDVAQARLGQEDGVAVGAGD